MRSSSHSECEELDEGERFVLYRCQGEFLCLCEYKGEFLCLCEYKGENVDKNSENRLINNIVDVIV